MPENKIVGYKRVFGFVLPDWVDERQINMMIGYVLVAVVMAFVLLLVVNPNKERIDANKKSYKTELDRYTSLQASKKSLDDLSSNVSSDQQDAIFQSMPMNYSPEEAVFQLRTLASSTGVSITEYTLPSGVVFDDAKKQFTGSATTKNEASVKFQSFPVSISVAGDISSILKFIDQVEKSLPLGFVSDMGIQEATKMSNTNRTQANLKLQVTYYQPIMVSFNLSNLKSFTKDDMDLIDELSKYSKSSFGLASGFSSSVSGTVNLNGGPKNLFGL